MAPDEENLDTFRASLTRFSYSSPLEASPTTATLLRRSPRQIVRSKTVEQVDTLPTLFLDEGKRKRRESRDQEDAVSKQSPKKPKRGYAAPETYAHLSFLQDHLQAELDVMFCGINPGYKSAEVGHHFANPTNHFWRCLHQIHGKRSGFTPRLLSPTEDRTLPELSRLGLTNLVARPSAEQAELSKAELVAAVPTFLQKVCRYCPRIVCFVGVGIWEIVEKAMAKMVSLPAIVSAPQDTPSSPHGRKSSKVKTSTGLQPYKLVHSVAGTESFVLETLFFVTPSTSGRVVSHQLPDKVKLFRALKICLNDLKQSKIDTGSMIVVPVTKSGERNS